MFARRDRILRGLVRYRMVVTMIDDATWDGVVIDVDDRTVVIDFRVDPAEKCYPMVPAGASNDDIILGPEFEKEHADVLHDTPEAII